MTHHEGLLKEADKLESLAASIRDVADGACSKFDYDRWKARTMSVAQSVVDQLILAEAERGKS